MSGNEATTATSDVVLSDSNVIESIVESDETVLPPEAESPHTEAQTPITDHGENEEPPITQESPQGSPMIQEPPIRQDPLTPSVPRPPFVQESINIVSDTMTHNQALITESEEPLIVTQDPPMIQESHTIQNLLTTQETQGLSMAPEPITGTTDMSPHNHTMTRADVPSEPSTDTILLNITDAIVSEHPACSTKRRRK